jgi:nicotinamidase-related amidase
VSAPTRVLIVIDAQREYFEGPLEIRYPTDSLPRIAATIDAATAAGIPIVVVQHDSGEGAPVFNPATDRYLLHPEIAQRQTGDWHHIVKQYSSAFPGTGLLDWLRAHGIDTITLVGYMTNNCILATAAEAETHHLSVEVLADATGAISIANSAGSADARTVHTTLMTVLHSNFAAVATTDAWTSAVGAGEPLPKDNLPASATRGALL